MGNQYILGDTSEKNPHMKPVREAEQVLRSCAELSLENAMAAATVVYMEAANAFGSNGRDVQQMWRNIEQLVNAQRAIAKWFAAIDELGSRNERERS